MGEKILLFSSSVLTLNLIERFLDSKEAPKMVDSEGREIKWSKKNTYCRFDGTTPACEREKLIEKFNNQKGFHLFLISTKAGSLGINLVSANRVIIMDASWNPCHDAQAVCRVYRYGQQKRTYVYRLVMYNSMEQAIFYRQISKHGLQQRVVDEVQCAAKVTTKQLEDLLKYDESLDIVSGEQETDDWEFDDSVLNEVVKTDGKLIAEKPFLHDSMITETEYGLSEEEKLEAELLYQQESEMHARNQNFNRISTGNSQNPEFEARLRELQYQNGALKGSLSDLRNMDYSDIGLNRTQFQIAPGSSSQIRYPTNNLNSLNNDRPLVHPLRANGALYKMSNNAVAKEVRSNFGTIFIHEDIVLPTTSNKMEFLKKGEHVRVMKMSGKTYLKRIDGGDILDATGTRYDPRMNMCNEVIQID
ncbi:hypothetical protein FO519_007656 [Halicephalobus sp. NKZ332]|nr:hypothetical protein FO519_007656 [Halicephalobus sp. NKZ332]